MGQSHPFVDGPTFHFVDLRTEIFENDTNICILSVELYNTKTAQDIIIREEMVKEKLAWPRFFSPEKEAKMFRKNEVHF